MGWPDLGEKRVPTARAIAALVAVFDLTVRSDAFAPIVSLLSDALAGDTAIADVTTWLLLAVGLYAVAPMVYPRATGFPRNRRGFKVVFAGVSVGMGVAITYVPTGTGMMAAVAVGLIGGGTAFVWYLGRWHGWRITHPKYPPVQPVEQFTPFEPAREEIKRDLQRTGALGLLGRWLWVAAFAGVLVVPCAMAAFVAFALANAAPLFDLLVLGWIAADRLGVLDPRARADAARRDPEQRIYGELGSSVRNLKGLFLVIYATIGLIFSAGYVYVGVAVAGDAIAGPSPAIDGVASAGWALVGVVTCLVVGGAYGIAVWYGHLRRIPAFVEVWAGDPRAVEDPPAPPPGHVIPPTVLGLTVVVVLAALERNWVRLTFGLGWPAVVAALVWGLVRWPTREPTPAWTEDRRILHRLLIHSLIFWGFGQVAVLDAVIAGERSPVALVDPPYVSVVALLVFAAYLPDVDRLDDADHPDRWLVLPAYLLVVAVGCAIAWIALAGTYATMFGTVAVICIVGSVALAAARRHGL